VYFFTAACFAGPGWNVVLISTSVAISSPPLEF
jgi:hypothetical protein